MVNQPLVCYHAANFFRNFSSLKNLSKKSFTDNFRGPFSKQGSIPISPPALSVTIPAAFSPPDALHLHAPDLETLAVSANRLLRFEFPPLRNPETMLRLVHRCLASPKPGKKFLETLPVPVLETAYQRLWQEGLSTLEEQTPEISDAENGRLALLILAEEVLQFNPSAWVQGDLHRLEAGAHRVAVHSHHFQNSTPETRTEPTLRAILNALELPADSLSARSAETLDVSYLICRTLHPLLPWDALLQRLSKRGTESPFAHLPRLQRLADLRRVMQAQHQWPKQAPIGPESTLSMLYHLVQTLLSTSFQAALIAENIAPTPQQTVVVEGSTEEVLLPAFGQQLGIPLSQKGIRLLTAGGKNQVLSLYDAWSRMLEGPIFILLDEDAKSVQDRLAPHLRGEDRIMVLPGGEMEDLYSETLLLKTINAAYLPHPPLQPATLHRVEQELSEKLQGIPPRRVDVLKTLWRSLSLGTLEKAQFDKVHFAARVAESLAGEADVPTPIQQLFKTLLAQGDSFRSRQQQRWEELA